MSIKHAFDDRIRITAATFAELEHEVHKHEAEGWVTAVLPWVQGDEPGNFGAKETVWNIVMKQGEVVHDEVAV